jgi:hypothetical protein
MKGREAMLGEMIGELRGKTTGTRVLPGDDYRYVKMEITWEQSGKLYGVDAFETGTFTVFERVPGQIYGSGQGIVMAGEDSAIWNGHGIAEMTGEGMGQRVVFAGAFQGAGALARLNGVLVIGEQEVDAEGNITTRAWEWKPA